MTASQSDLQTRSPRSATDLGVTSGIVTSLRRAWPYAVAAVVSLVAALWTYRPWNLDGTVMVPGGDSLAFHAWVQNTIESGWYEVGERLSAPFIQNSHSYTVTDELVFAGVGRVLAPLTGSAGAAVTWWVVLSFPLAAITAVALARYLHLSPAVSIVPGVAFALLPDHFIRATGHFSLATTWVIPLGLLAAISLVHPPNFTKRRRAWFEVAILAGCVSIALVNAYYAVFSGLLVAVAGVGALVATRAWRVLVLAAGRGLALVIPLTTAVLIDRLLLPTPGGYSALEVTRSIADAEIYGGKVSAMLLPSSAHRFAIFRSLRTGYDATFPNPAEGPSLGIVAVVGFVGLVVWAVFSYWRPAASFQDPRLRTLAALTWAALFVYVVGGLGTVWSMLLNGGGIRVWSRMHVFIALLALLALGIAIDRLRQRGIRLAVVSLVLLVVLVDQTSPLYRPNADLAKSVRDETTAMTGAIAARAGGNAMIFQYPQVNFPLLNRTTAPASAYDGFLPYLYSQDLRWSYGGLEGGPTADWQVSLATRPFTEQVSLLAVAGFAGLLVDRATLQSTPDQAAEVTQTLGEADFVSSTGRWDYYDLTTGPGLCGQGTEPIEQELTDLAVHPPLLYPGIGMSSAAGGWLNGDGPGSLRVVTLRDGGWPAVRVSFTISNPVSALTVQYPDGSEQVLAPGTSDLSWEGGVTSAETPITIQRTGGSGSYSVTSLAVAADLSADAAHCLTELVAGVTAAP